MPAIHEIVGYRIKIGPLVLRPILGSEVISSHLTIVQEDQRVLPGEGRNGHMAKVLDSHTVLVVEFGGGVFGKRRTVSGKHINRDPITKRRYYYG